MKKKIAISALACLLTLSGTAIAAPQAAYQPAPRETKGQLPLMIIRFNEPHVDFAKALYETMNQAFKIKPGAHFDVVSVSQHSNDGSEQQIYDDIAARNTARVMKTFDEMGMPQSRLTLTHTSEHVLSSEVRIYVH
ncbi:MAG TPA: hypothetical protein VFT64_11160 [Rickettsiales bacterium]|nr:hypothetical protein [Rickettsiales bacterium]